MLGKKQKKKKRKNSPTTASTKNKNKQTSKQKGMIVKIVKIYLALSLVLWAVWGHFQGGSLCLTSSVCWSLQCLISQGGWWWTLFFFFFRLTCSVALWGGRDAANK